MFILGFSSNAIKHRLPLPFDAIITSPYYDRRQDTGHPLPIAQTVCGRVKLMFPVVPYRQWILEPLTNKCILREGGEGVRVNRTDEQINENPSLYGRTTTNQQKADDVW